MKNIAPYLLVPCLLLLILSGSCREDFDFQPSSGNLSFSKDTVYLDTIFTTIGSSAYTLKVYNNSNEDVIIPQVRLAQGNQSSYRLNVDGMAGKEFENVPLLAKDSLFVFVETTFDIAVTGETEFLYTDQIFFGDTNGGQTVELVTLVQDAIFLYPRNLNDGTTETITIGEDELGNPIQITGFLLEEEELNFSNEKPYVIYGYAAVAEGNTLTLDPGTRVHFHENSGIFVSSGGRLLVNGGLSEDQELFENEVIFEGDRLEPAFADVAGQWGGLWLAAASSGHQLQHLTVKNATIGILVEGSDPIAGTTAVLQNCRVYNSALGP